MGDKVFIYIYITIASVLSTGGFAHCKCHVLLFFIIFIQLSPLTVDTGLNCARFSRKQVSDTSQRRTVCIPVVGHFLFVCSLYWASSKTPLKPIFYFFIFFSNDGIGKSGNCYDDSKSFTP